MEKIISEDGVTLNENDAYHACWRENPKDIIIGCVRHLMEDRYKEKIKEGCFFSSNETCQKYINEQSLKIRYNGRQQLNAVWHPQGQENG